MSYKAIDTVTCPICGSKQKMTIWAVINGNINTRIKQKILNGSFFEHTCKCCGETSLIAYNTLYEDDKNHVLIYYAQTVLDVVEAHKAISERRKSVTDKDDYRIRIVTSPNAFREKVRIFDTGFDDRVVEIMKTLILEELGSKKSIGHVDEILCYARDDGNFDVDVLGDNIGTMTVKREFYDYINNKVKRLLDKQYPNPKEFGLDAAIEFLERNHFNSN